MNIGDQLTWAYRSLIIITLVWMRFGEAYVNPRYTKWIALAIWAVVLFFLFKPRGKKKEQSEGVQGARAN
jgi:hypothetical protein